MLFRLSRTNIPEYLKKGVEKDVSVDQPIQKDSVARFKSKSNASQILVNHGCSGTVKFIKIRTQLNKQQVWIPKTAKAQKSDEFVLLGDIPVGKWDDDNDDNGDNTEANRQGTFDARTKMSKDILTAEQDRKRKMFLDRHDALLDQGKVCLCFVILMYKLFILPIISQINHCYFYVDEKDEK